jgi:DNA replication and repair protein RecF
VTLRRVQVTDFRCLQSAALDLDPRFTLISGANASGKTSLLEAIYVLGRGRSFRTRRLEHLIRLGRSASWCSARWMPSSAACPWAWKDRAPASGQIGWRQSEFLGGVGAPAPRANHRSGDPSPDRGRPFPAARFLDWGVFHVEPRFVDDWQRFQQALKQRNAALKARQPKAVTSAWDGDLASLRRGLVGGQGALCGVPGRGRGGHYAAVARNGTGDWLPAGLGARPRLGRGAGAELGCRIRRAARRRWGRIVPSSPSGSTILGVKDRISRGQQKLLAAALLMAQVKLFPKIRRCGPACLLDDPAAELDDERLTGLIEEVSAQEVQLIVTTLHPEFSQFGTPGMQYRIEGGEVRAA